MKRLVTRLSCVVLFLSTLSHGFEPTFKRTISGNDWFRTFRRQFPLAMNITPALLYGGSSPTACKWRNDQLNIGIMGDVDPGTGEYLPKQPNANFMAWLGECVEVLAREDLDRAIKNGEWSKRFSLAPELSKPWSQLPSDERIKIIRYQLLRLIGPMPIKNQDAWVQQVDEAIAAKSITVKEAYVRIVVWVAARSEYLNY